MKKLVYLSMMLIVQISIKSQITFGNQDTLSTHMYKAQQVIAADIDGDGLTDAVSASVGNSSPGTWGQLFWFKNNNDGNKKFAFSSQIGIGGEYIGIAVGDLNNDGTNDVLYADRTEQCLAWYSNDGTGSFTKEGTIIIYYPLSIGAITSLEICDMNKDNINDIVVSNFNYNTIYWYENTNGDGSTWTAHQIAAGVNVTDIFIADIDKDGNMDIVAALNTLVWYKNNNDGTWTGNDITMPTTDKPWTVYVNDLNNDNFPDIIVGTKSSSGSAQLAWIENDGNALFSNFNSLYNVENNTGSFVFDIASADLDLDGNQDIVMVSSENKILSFTNLGNGNFADAKQVTNQINTGNWNASIALADLDSVADIDLLSATYGDDKIAYYNNITPIILQNPQDAIPVCVGTDSVMFTVKAMNALYYYWQENSGNGFSNIVESDSHYHGQRSNTLYVNAWYANMNNYQYKCKIIGQSPAFANATSDSAVLSVDENIQANISTSTNNLCEATDLNLSGNDPSPNTGYWSSSSNLIHFDNESAHNNTASNLIIGVFDLYWTIDNKSCGLSIDTLQVKNYQYFTADAGTDAGVCDTSKYQLQANTPPSPSTGTWKWSDSRLAFNDTSLATAIVSNLRVGSNRLNWTVNNGACGSSAEVINITNYHQIVADAGEDITLCNQTVTSLDANDPGTQGDGYWTASNSEVVFNNSTYHSVNLSNIPHGETIFTWTIEIPVCGSTSDQVIVRSYNSVSFDEQPIDTSITEGETANFIVKLSGDVAYYQWYKDNMPLTDDTRILGATADSILISNAQTSDAGMYKCVITDLCYNQTHSSDSAQLIVNELSTGFDELNTGNIIVYPNPSNGSFIIENKNGVISQMRIMNLQGAVIYENNNLNSSIIRMDLTKYPKGIYFLDIDKNAENKKYKMVIE